MRRFPPKQLSAFVLVGIIGMLLGAILMASLPASALTTDARIAKLENQVKSLQYSVNLALKTNRAQSKDIAYLRYLALDTSVQSTNIVIPMFCSGRVAVWKSLGGLGC